MNENIIIINGVEYIPRSECNTSTPVEKIDEMDYVIVRTYSAGVFAGYLAERKGKEGTLINARRIWYWSGASSLSQLAVDGTSSPNDCKFPCEVPKIELTEIIEVLQVSKKAKLSINSVPVWEQ